MSGRSSTKFYTGWIISKPIRLRAFMKRSQPHTQRCATCSRIRPSSRPSNWVGAKSKPPPRAGGPDPGRARPRLDSGPGVRHVKWRPSLVRSLWLPYCSQLRCAITTATGDDRKLLDPLTRWLKDGIGVGDGGYLWGYLPRALARELACYESSWLSPWIH